VAALVPLSAFAVALWSLRLERLGVRAATAPAAALQPCAQGALD
jgi:hypothetical protein